MITLEPLKIKDFPTVFEWTERYPWPKELNDYKEWERQMLNRLTAALSHNGELLAVFSFDILGSGILELHFDSPDSNVPRYSAVEAAALSIERQLFEDGNTQLIVGWTPAANRGVVQLAATSGIKWDGVEMFRGKRRWIRLSITREQYEQQKQTANNDPAVRNPEWGV